MIEKKNLTIGALAKATDVNVETIRYYQRIGLIQEPRKPTRGYRCYLDTDISLVHSIKRAQNLGFTLGEIKELLALNQQSCNEARKIAERKYALINTRIADLQAIQKELKNLIVSCSNNQSEHNSCAVLNVLSKDISQ